MRARLDRLTLPRILVGLAAVFLLIGFWKAVRGSGNDYRVFYSAAQLAHESRSNILYREGPDRFLYAPGFAYLLIPLALLPYGFSHVIWLGLCLAAFLGAMRILARRLRDEYSADLFSVGVGILFLMRSIWIDLRYGQVNLLILSASVWALISLRTRSPESGSGKGSKFISWYFFSLAAFAKLYPLALFSLPLFQWRHRTRRDGMAYVLAGSVAGFATLVLLPVLLSEQTSRYLYSEWLQALLGRGFPLETHNQSLLAFFHRVFSGEIIRSHQTGGEPMNFYSRILSDQGIQSLFGVATVGMGIVFARTAVTFGKFGDSLSLGICIALSFLPGHLIWKPYFLMGIPLAAALFAFLSREPNEQRRKQYFLVFGGLFLVTHLSSAEVIGHGNAAWYEALSGFLWVHIALIVFAVHVARRAPRPDLSPRELSSSSS